ncbi:MAG: DUF4270 family protein [Sphingobacterium sp.]
MNQLFKRNITFFAVPLLILFLASACDKDMSVVLDNSTTGDVNVALLDSFSVSTATVQMGDLPSSGSGTLLIGKATQDTLGTVKSSAYFRLGLISFAQDIPEAAVFDSINIRLPASKPVYTYGDTTKAQTIRVYKLTEDIELKTLSGGIQNDALPFFVTGPSLFSDQKFAHEPAEIGAATFQPYMNLLDTLKIPINKNVGQEIFDLLKAGDQKVVSNENFYDYFKGLALIPDENNTAVLRFSDTVNVELSYSYIATDGTRKTGAKTLSIVDKSFASNNVEYDRSQTDFKGLTPENSIATSATGGLTYIQAGTGVVAKLSFPSLKEFLRDENISINKAELVVETAPRSLNQIFPNSVSASLLVADFTGVPVSYLTDPYIGSIQQVPHIPGTQTGSNGKFIFNLIQYLKNVKSNSAYDESSLYLTTNMTELSNSFNTTFLATVNGKPQIKLNILYTKFK